MRSDNRVVAGVCAGVAKNFGWNVRMLRSVWLLLSVVLLGSPVLFYLVLWMVVPPESKQKKSYEERMKERLGRR